MTDEREHFPLYPNIDNPNRTDEQQRTVDLLEMISEDLDDEQLAISDAEIEITWDRRITRCGFVESGDRSITATIEYTVPTDQ